MTAPRQVLPGKTYLLTRRCAQRRYRLVPSPLTNETFGYILAVAAQRHGVIVHCVCVMSNHHHLVITDVRAELPAFAQDLHAQVARALNASQGQWESFWSPGSYSAVALETRADVLDKAAYVLANPVTARQVRRGREWPGLWSDPARIGGAPLTFERPAFFREEGSMPETATLHLVPPPGWSAEEFRAALEAELAAREESVQRTASEDGRGFASVRRVLAQKVTARPAGEETRRRLNPRIGARDPWKRLEAIMRLTGFVAAYRAARERFKAGERDVLFPAGTYWMRVFDGVCCAPPLAAA